MGQVFIMYEALLFAISTQVVNGINYLVKVLLLLTKCNILRIRKVNLFIVKLTYSFASYCTRVFVDAFELKKNKLYKQVYFHDGILYLKFSVT